MPLGVKRCLIYNEYDPPPPNVLPIPQLRDIYALFIPSQIINTPHLMNLSADVTSPPDVNHFIEGISRNVNYGTLSKYAYYDTV